jgi:arylformamidase
MKIVDISMPLSPETQVFPGDPPVVFDVLSAVAAGDPNTLSRISLSAHTGTHMDAPSHVFSDERTVDSIGLDALVGPAWVMDVSGSRPVDSRALAAARPTQPMKRLLIRSGDPNSWFSSDACRWLARFAPSLIGFDGISVDSLDNDELEVHKTLLGAGTVLIENLDLSGVVTGMHFLVCLPLKLIGTEGAPVRAILIDGMEAT